VLLVSIVMAPPGLHGPGQGATRNTDASLELFSSSSCATGVLDPGVRPAFAWRRVSPHRSLSPRAAEAPGVRLNRAGSDYRWSARPTLGA
jgi:hypothetical protein